MKPLIIAEIGINHNGSIETAKQLIDMAQSCGCDLVKFQKRTIDIVYSKEYLDSPRNSPWGTTQREQKMALEFGKKEYEEIDEYCHWVGMDWFASAWDLNSQAFIIEFDTPHNKIASPMLTHLPLLEMVASERKHTFISTGMSTFAQIDKAVEIFQNYRCPITLMHCTSTYPAQDNELNLKIIRTLKMRYGCPVGYSGHEVGLLPSILAVAQGAVAIERHITLDRAMYGSDQAASVERQGLERLVRDCKSVDVILGDGIKKIYESEQKSLKSLRYYDNGNHTS